MSLLGANAGSSTGPGDNLLRDRHQNAAQDGRISPPRFGATITERHDAGSIRA